MPSGFRCNGSFASSIHRWSRGSRRSAKGSSRYSSKRRSSAATVRLCSLRYRSLAHWDLRHRSVRYHRANERDRNSTCAWRNQWRCVADDRSIVAAIHCHGAWDWTRLVPRHESFARQIGLRRLAGRPADIRDRVCRVRRRRDAVGVLAGASRFEGRSRDCLTSRVSVTAGTASPG